MTPITIAGPVTGAAVLTLVFALMWRTYREPYLGWWLVACVIWLGRYAYGFWAQTMSMPSGDHVLPLLAVARGFFILMGGYAYVGRTLPRAWVALFAADLGVLAFEVAYGPVRVAGFEAVTHYVLYCASMVTAGVLFVIRPADRVPEAWVVSLSLAVIGAMQLVFPFATALGPSWSIAFSIVVNIALLAAGIGVMMVYFRRELRSRAQLTQRLERALESALGGYLPICAHCKSIRDEQGDWQRLERYLSDRTDAAFTHGICPGCVEEHFPAAAIAQGTIAA